MRKEKKEIQKKKTEKKEKKKEFSQLVGQQRVTACQETNKRIILQGSHCFTFLIRDIVAERERERGRETERERDLLQFA